MIFGLKYFSLGDFMWDILIGNLQLAYQILKGGGNHKGTLHDKGGIRQKFMFMKKGGGWWARHP